MHRVSCNPGGTVLSSTLVCVGFLVLNLPVLCLGQPASLHVCMHASHSNKASSGAYVVCIPRVHL